MAFESGQWGPDTFIDNAGNTVLIGATVTASGYVCTVDALGNLTVTGPADDSVTLTVTPATGAAYTQVVPVRPLVSELETVQGLAVAAETPAGAQAKADAAETAAEAAAAVLADAAVAAAVATAATDATTKANAAEAAAEATAAAALAASEVSATATFVAGQAPVDPPDLDWSLLRLVDKDAAVKQFAWTTADELTARALGWKIVTDRQFAGGADPTGTEDCRLAFQAAFDASGAVTWAGPGDYAFKTKRGSVEATKNVLEPPNDTRLVGAGRTLTRLFAHDDLPANSPLIRATDPEDMEFAHFELDGNKAHLAPGDVGVQEDEGINWKGVPKRIRHRDLWIHHTGQDCIDFDSLGSTDAEGVTIEDCLLEHAGGHGIHGGCYGIVVSRTIIRYNCFERAAAGVTPYGGYDIQTDNQTLVDCHIYGNAIRQLVIDGQVTGNCKNASVRGGTITAQDGTVAVFMQLNVDNAHLTDVKITGAADQHAVEGGAGTHKTRLLNCEIISSSTTKNAVHITGNRTKVQGGSIFGGYRGASLAGDDCLVGGVEFDGQTQNNLALTSGNRAHVTDNRFLGAVAQASLTLNNGGHFVCDNRITQGVSGLTGNTVRRNVGLVTENSGSGTIADTQTFVVVNHGLGGGGTSIILTSVVVTPRTAAEVLRVSNQSATTFTVTRTGTVGALDFYWYAERA